MPPLPNPPPLDALIVAFDRALRTLAAPAHARRPNPGAAFPEPDLGADARQETGRLMRVNHTGEVCAQALYQGQALTVRDADHHAALVAAAEEEVDHLAWCESRLSELGTRTSLLNPLFYATSFALGAASGLAGDRWNLAFLVETERQVEHHLSGHLDRIPPDDQRTRAIVEQMRIDEVGHADMAEARGAAQMPSPIKSAMGLMAKVMTRSTYYL